MSIVILIVSIALILLSLRLIVESRRIIAVRKRMMNIQRLEADLGITDPKHYTLGDFPTTFHLNLNTRLMNAGDCLTICCSHMGCRYSVTTIASEMTVLSESNIPGGDKMLLHQAKENHYNVAIHDRMFA